MLQYPLLGSRGSLEAELALILAIHTFHTLGVPVADQGTATELSLLGILIDTNRFLLQLPAEKVAHLRHLVSRWRSKRACTCNDLELFVGHLAHAAIVIRFGWIFLRPLFALLSTTAQLQFYVCLHRAVRTDLQWWDCFLQDWNGSSFFSPPTPSVHMFSDASGSFGCGAFDTRQGGFQFQWRDKWANRNIATKEMVPVVVVAALWGESWGATRPLPLRQHGSSHSPH